MSRYSKLFALLLLAVVIAACGSSGSISTSTTSTAEIEVRAVVDAFLDAFTGQDVSVFTDTVEISLRDGRIVPVSPEEVWRELRDQYFSSNQTLSRSFAYSSEVGQQAQLVDRRVTIRGREATVIGTLIVDDTVLPTRIGLTKPAQSWKINRVYIFDLSGSWVGRWHSETFNLTGHVEAEMTQNGLNVEGNVHFPDSSIITNAWIEGTVSGERTIFGQVSGGTTSIQFESTHLMPDRIEGTYVARFIGGTDRGTFVLERHFGSVQ